MKRGALGTAVVFADAPSQAAAAFSLASLKSSVFLSNRRA